MPMPVVFTSTSLLWIQPDQGIDTHNGHTRLHRGFQLLDLAHAGLQNTCLQAVVYLAVGQVQTVVLVVLRLRELFRVLRGGIGRVHRAL